MKRLLLLSTLSVALAASSLPLAADEAVRAAQAALTNAGYYSGPADGELNADTRAALRRYQIRNQLEPSGDLTPETLAALNREGGAPVAATPAPEPYTPPAPPAPATPPAPPVSAPAGIPLPEDPRLAVLFAKTPYEHAQPEVQLATLRKAQVRLAERRFYRGPIDGIPGPGFAEALLRYQESRNLPRTGRLDIDTLAEMHLLPIAKVGRPRVAPAPYRPPVPAVPGAVRGQPLD